MTVQELRFDIYDLRPGQRLHVPESEFSSGTVSQIVDAIREQYGRRYNTWTNPAGTTVERVAGSGDWKGRS